ncbi:MAG: hypothetical protein EA415_04705 [Sphaerobacteraceae bacterium]|nr:MAG: hypothetical protein EA415_04705 [Sphaerobacteraceae bacterium]
MSQHIILPDDVRRAGQICIETLSPARDMNWQRNAAGLDWSCRFTLDHIVGAVTAYAGDLAVRRVEQVEVLRKANAEQSINELLQQVEVASAVLADVCAAAPDDARGYHPSGPADWSGFAAMGCTEILIHTDDICWAFRIEFNVEPELCRRILDRLFPWAPQEGNPWQIMRWATGRGYLEGYESIGPDWEWHSRPLAEWNHGEDHPK